MKRFLKLFKHDVRKDYFWWKVIKGIDYILVTPATKVYKASTWLYDKTNEVMEKYNFPPNNPLATEQSAHLYRMNKISVSMRRKHIILTQRNKRMKVGMIPYNTNVINPIYGYGN